ncbi:asparaginase, partial [Hylemonella gracilis ATCC 19624]
ARRVMGARGVRKVHATRLDAFDSSGEPDAARLVDNPTAVGGSEVRWSWAADSEASAPPSADRLASLLAPVAWPRVELLLSHAAASGALVQALCDTDGARRLGVPPLRGLVVAATGNGTLHRELEAALHHAQSRGVRVLIATRCAEGGLRAGHSASMGEGLGFATTDLSPVKARLSLMLELLDEH